MEIRVRDNKYVRFEIDYKCDCVNCKAMAVNNVTPQQMTRWQFIRTLQHNCSKLSPIAAKLYDALQFQ